MGVGQALGPRLPLLLQLLVARQHINLWRAKYLKSRMLSKSNKNSHFTQMSKFLRPLSSDHLRVDDLRIEVVPLSELLALRLEPLDGLPEGGQVAGHVIQLLGGAPPPSPRPCRSPPRPPEGPSQTATPGPRTPRCRTREAGQG